MDINSRKDQLTCLQNYLKDVDAELTMILQNLQWDRKLNVLEGKPKVACQYDKGHRVPPDKLVEHENACFLKSQRYAEGERLLPSPVDSDATTLVKLNGDNIAEIIKNAAYCQPAFVTVLIGSFGCDKMYNIISKIEGSGCSGHQPLTLERLQATYTADERRAIHDAVVNQVPSCQDLSDLALLSTSNTNGEASRPKTKLEILAELRDMRRRRTKYRVPAKTRNYSDVLRDVISTQMELYNQAHTSINEMKNSDPSVDRRALSSSKEKSTSQYRDITLNRDANKVAGQTSTSTKDHHSLRREERNQEYENRKRRRDESDLDYNSPSTTSKADHHRDRYDSKSKRKDDGYYSSKSRRESHRHDDRYDGRQKFREKEYRSKERHSNRRKDYDTSRSKYGVDRDNRHERDVHKVTIKKEQDDDGVDFHSSGDLISSDHETISIVRKIKEENAGRKDRSKKNERDKQRERKEDYIQNIKLERDVIDRRSLDTDDSSQHCRVQDKKPYKNSSERFRNSDDEYRRDKRKEKE